MATEVAPGRFLPLFIGTHRASGSDATTSGAGERAHHKQRAGEVTDSVGATWRVRHWYWPPAQIAWPVAPQEHGWCSSCAIKAPWAPIQLFDLAVSTFGRAAPKVWVATSTCAVTKWIALRLASPIIPKSNSMARDLSSAADDSKTQTLFDT